MPHLYGLDAELAAKQKEKYDPEREKQAREFIEKILEEPSDATKSFHLFLKDGQALCRMAVKLGISNAKVYTGTMPFKQMENIQAFLIACESIGVRKSEQFQTVDLFEAKNMTAVVDSIWSFSRMAHAKKIITDPELLLGPKLSMSR